MRGKMNSLDHTNFDSVIHDTPCVVLCWAAWCGPCHSQEDLTILLEKEFPNIIFCKLNTEENPDIASDCKLIVLPTIICYKDGLAVKRFVGLQDIETLREMIRLL
jgi:thioredoxin-like negative regulator of GroEL